ncbi:MAG TPA: hypothetical protein PKD24_15260 [Pyrinomonadaceae bacterium]|nr:hypothetical protein [Pyrinomonadaceae bacterium]HMP66779.1 hypothetical protein [Pyrinomonadaceae bacterium]
MPQWKDKIEQHGVYKAIETIISDIDDLDPLEDKESAANLKRVREILERTLKILTGGNPYFKSRSTLDSIESNLTSLTTSLGEVVTHSTNPELLATYFEQMEPHLSQILNYAGQIRAVASPISENSAIEKVGSIRLNALAQTNKIRKEVNEEIKEVRTSLIDIDEKLQGLVADIAAEKARADSLINQFQADFNAGQKQRDAEFSEKLKKEYSKEVSNVISGLKSEVNRLVASTENTVRQWAVKNEELMATLEGHIEKAGLTAQTIAATILKAGYEETAEKQKDDATFWSRVTIGVSVIMVVFVGVMLVQSLIVDKPFSPESILPKALFTAVLVGVARWSAKLERRHSEASRSYEELSLELSTIAPFIATLPEELQREITKQLVPNYFVGRRFPNNRDAEDASESFSSPSQSVSETIKRLVSTKE